MPNQQDLHNATEPLTQRIDLQTKFGTRDLATWFLELASPNPTDRVLDIGCGSGNHLVPFANVTTNVTGLDISEELLQVARSTACSLGLENVRLIRGSGDSFDLKGETFDLIFCNFAIYYMNATEVIGRMARHLTPRGTAYVMGSPDENAPELLDIHARATDFLPETYAPGYSDIRKYQRIMEQFFGEFTFHRFINPINFPSPEQFLNYYRATDLFQSSLAVEPSLEAKVREICEQIFGAQGRIRITKVVDTAELRGPIQN